MKQRTDALVASDEKLQQFLMWVNQKSLAVDLPYKPAAVRAFYFTLYLDRALNLGLDAAFVRVLDLNLDAAIDPALDPALDPAIVRAIDPAIVRALILTLAPTLIPTLIPTLDPAIDLALSPELRQALQELKTQLHDPDSGEKIFKLWWHIQSRALIRQLRTLMIEPRNIGHDWQFRNEQKELLKQYYDANKLLVDCLNSDCNVTPAVRSHIEDTLLLPIAEIQKRRSCFDR